MRFKHGLMVMGMMLIVATSLTAGPTIFGPSGLIVIPTAESLKYKQFNMAVDYAVNPDTNTSQWFYKFNLGTFKNWEIGVVGGEEPDEGMYVNVKYFLMDDESRYPLSIAVGLDNVSSRSKTGLYMVASKQFQGGLRAHIGFKAIFSRDANDDTEINPVVMTGVEYYLSDDFLILMDLDGEGKNYSVNAGMQYFPKPDLALRLYLLDIGGSQDGAMLNLGVAHSTYF